jgi:hypothetical protein
MSHCGYCGVELPEEFRLSAEDAIAMENEIDEIKKRQQREAEKERAKRKEQSIWTKDVSGF